MSETFICAMCDEEFPYGEEGEALKELEENFPNTSVEDCGRVCDDCYEKARPAIKTKQQSLHDSLFALVVILNIKTVIVKSNISNKHLIPLIREEMRARRYYFEIIEE